MSMDTTSYRRTVLNVLIAAIRTGNTNAVSAVRAKAIAVLGCAEYAHLYKQAYNIINTKDYKFIEFSPKASSNCADESYVSSETPTHNED